MSKIYSGSSNYIPKNTTKTIHTKAGKLRSILLTGDNTGEVTFYDNTTATGNILLVLDMQAYNGQPYLFNFPELIPLVFSTGLTIVTGTNMRCFIITEA